MDKKAQHSFEKDSNDSMSIGSFSQNSMNSMYSSSSTFSLSPSSSSSSHSNGPLYELSELMTHLPIKRGLSKFYEGKAQSFRSLAMVESIEDLPKKCISQRKKMKSCKTSVECLHTQRISFKISKKDLRRPINYI